MSKNQKDALCPLEIQKNQDIEKIETDLIDD